MDSNDDNEKVCGSATVVVVVVGRLLLRLMVISCIWRRMLPN